MRLPPVAFVGEALVVLLIVRFPLGGGGIVVLGQASVDLRGQSDRRRGEDQCGDAKS